MIRHTSPPAATTTDPERLCLIGLLGTRYATLHFSDPGSNGGAREPSGLCHRCDTSPPDGHGFASGPAATHFFIHHRAQSLIFVPYGRDDFCIPHKRPSYFLFKGKDFKKDVYGYAREICF